jgi:hypothetical protein
VDGQVGAVNQIGMDGKSGIGLDDVPVFATK